MQDRGAPRGGRQNKLKLDDAGEEVAADGAAVELRKRFGQSVRKHRQRLALTQEALAERSDLSVDAIRRIEAGRFSPTLETLRKLSGGLEASLPTLFQAMGDERPDHIAEICDYLARRSGRELKIAWKVLRAMFDDR